MMQIDTHDALPEGWSLSSLPEVATLIMGQSPPGSTYNDDGNGLPFFQGKTDFGERNPTVRKWCSKPNKTAQPGDVLLSIRAPVGPTNVASEVCAIGRGLAAIRPNDASTTEYILHWLRFQEDELADKGTGSTFTAINRSHLNSVEVPLPPLAEQKRIVAKVDALLKRVGKARERLDRVPGILKKFRQSVLAAACSGRLTADWREANGTGKSGVQLLRRLQDDHRERWELARTPREYKAAARPAFDLDCELPESWAIASPEEVCEVIVDCPHSTPKWTDEGEICLRTTNFKPGLLDLTEVRYVSSATYRERISRLEPTAGDVVYSREGGILGIACTIPDGLKACLGQRMMLLRTLQGCQPRFLMHMLNSPAITAIVRDKTGGTSSPHLNVGDIRSFPIPLPSMAEQAEIIQRVDSLFAVSEALEWRIALGVRKVGAICQSVLSQAFAGELVKTEAELARREGRDYEPASVLLERIAAGHTAAENGKPKSRRNRKSPSRAT